MFGGNWMDTFMDKLAQKFTAQEMIKANAAAEAAELQRTRDQVKKYNDCLQEMKQVNDNTKEALAQIEKTLAAGVEQFQKAEIPTEGFNELVENSLRKIQELQAGTEDVQKVLEDRLAATGIEITEFVHKENVKVYRNVQAVVVDELKKQTDALERKMEDLAATQRSTRNLAASAMIFALIAAAALVAQFLIEFGVI
jgi:hypothetical protein